MDISVLDLEPPQAVAQSRRQALLTKVCYANAVIMVLYILALTIVSIQWTEGRTIAATVGTLFLVLGTVNRNPKYYNACAILFVSIILLGGFKSSMSNGGVSGFVASILIFGPIAAGIFLGKRATIASAAVVLVLLFGLLVLGKNGWVALSPYPPETVPMIALIWLSTSTIIVAAAVGFFVSDADTKIAELAEYQKKLIHVANHDPLTGLANRQGLQSHVTALMSGDHQPGAQVCIGHLDLDRFKAINDTHGHPVGDSVLRQAAAVIKRHIPAEALVARVGGDEFVVVYADSAQISSDEIQRICEDIIGEISRPIKVNGVQCLIGASIGFAISDLECCSIDTLMINADLALYNAKRNGRGLAREFKPAMRAMIERTRDLTDELASAFEEDRIYCVAQPQVSIETGEVLSIESLGRVKTKSGKTLLPADFLPHFEETKRLVEFDYRVACKSLDLINRLERDGYYVPSISINASADSLRSPGYADKLHNALEQRGLSPDRLVVEILENVLIAERTDVILETVVSLQKYGIRTVMDDFGSGNASITNLVRLGLDSFKVDRSLVAEIETQHAQSVLKTIQNLSNSFDIPAVVEGVETAHQYAILKSLGFKAVQGFGICKPLAIDDLPAWFDRYGSSTIETIRERAFKV